MIAQRKQSKASTIPSTVLRSVDQEPIAVFSLSMIDNLRRMITGLMYREKIPARIAMLSALRGEGVTYTTLALATTLASDLPAKICLVELNWWAPGLSTIISGAAFAQAATTKNRRRAAPEAAPVPARTASPGLSAVLAGNAALDDALVQTELPNLALLPAGELAPAQRHSIARSAALEEQIAALSQRYDCLLLDIPAISSTSDAIALASLGDCGCLVIQQGVTPASKVREALDDVKHIPMIGTILNQTRIYTPRWLYNLIPQE